MISRIRRIVAHPAVKTGYFLLLVAAAGYYLVRWESRLPDLVGQIRPGLVGFALVLTGLSSLLYSYIQYILYHQLGTRPTFGSVFRIVNISQLGKYVPGKVLFAGNFYLLSREAGIGNVEIGAAFAVSMALWILTASLCGLPALGLVQPVLRYTILALPLLLALLIHPRFLNWLLRRIQAVARQTMGSAVRQEASPPAGDERMPVSQAGSPLDKLRAPFYLKAGFLYLATWGLAGSGCYLCLASLSEARLDLFPLALASIALGTVAGFLALFAPVGLGVREGIGALLLAPIVGADVALLGMVLLRGITVVVDLALALWALLTRPRARSTPRPPG